MNKFTATSNDSLRLEVVKDGRAILVKKGTKSEIGGPIWCLKLTSNPGYEYRVFNLDNGTATAWRCKLSREGRKYCTKA